MRCVLYEKVEQGVFSHVNIPYMILRLGKIIVNTIAII